jgi:hypothetical protein
MYTITLRSALWHIQWRLHWTHARKRHLKKIIEKVTLRRVRPHMDGHFLAIFAAAAGPRYAKPITNQVWPKRIEVQKRLRNQNTR